MSKCIKCNQEHVAGFYDNGFVCGTCYQGLFPILMLRDQFAMSIAPAAFANVMAVPEFNNETWENTVLAVAKVCYKFANACIAEREKK